MPLISPGAGGPSSARACGAFGAAFGLASSAERRAGFGRDEATTATARRSSRCGQRVGVAARGRTRVPVEGPGAVRPSDHALG